MKVVLGLGTNQGNRLRALRLAVRQLKCHPSFKVHAVSAIYESDALLPPGAPDHWNQPFLNLALLCSTSLDPLSLLAAVKSIEKQLGRVQQGRWSPRVMDIDLLMFEHEKFKNQNLEVPHPGLKERPFAVLPLADLALHWLDPSLTALTHRWRHADPSEVPFHTRRSSYCLTQVMGIVNVTPDSFSDGGQFLDPTAALTQARHFVREGCDVLDLGAESTRPGAEAVSLQTEWLRLQPVLQALKQDQELSVQLSVDTRHPEIAAQALDLGADCINDVSGCENPQMLDLLAGSSCDVVIMHSLGVPPSQGRTLPLGEDPIAVLMDWAQHQILKLNRAGIAQNRIWLDPGIGFGKTAQQTWEILRRVGELHALQVPLLVGHSRKSFLLSIGAPSVALQRDLETHILSEHCIRQGVECLRVHNVAELKRSMHVLTQLYTQTLFLDEKKTYD